MRKPSKPKALLSSAELETSDAERERANLEKLCALRKNIMDNIHVNYCAIEALKNQIAGIEMVMDVCRNTEAG